MLDFASSILANADLFILIFFRTSGLIISSPVFGRKIIPAMTKIGFSAFLSFLFFSIAPKDTVINYSTLIGFAAVCLVEVFLGVALAFITNIFFTLTYTAGQLIDMQIGFGIVSVYDPQNNSQIPMSGNILNVVLLILFFSVNGHLRLIEIIHLTFNKIPVGNISFTPAIGLAVLEVFTQSFLLGVMVAMPIISSGLILEFMFGLLIRSAPQMNMFVIGIPIKIFVGVVMLMFTLPVFANFSERIFLELFSSLEKVFSSFAAV